MILRKPYAFFIKMFRPIHFIFAFCNIILVYHQNKIINFLNTYLYTSELIDTKNIKSTLINSSFYIVPIIMILLTLLVFGIMYRKNKPFKFYFITIFIYLAILIINIYTSNFLTIFQDTTIAIKTVKLIHDLVLLTIIIESILTIIYIVRGLGVNFKKFDFSSDISKFDIDESDKEEFELNVKFNLDEAKRKRKERIRKLKYFYLEHKLIVNIGLFLFFLLIIGLTIFIIIKVNNYNKEGKYYSLEEFNIVVENTYILNTNYEGSRITSNYLIVVDAKISSNYSSKSLFLKDFSLKIGNATILPTKQYNKYLTDIGIGYNNDVLTSEYKNYIFVYEIPSKYSTSVMNLRYTNKGYNFDIRLNPKNLSYGEDHIESKIGDSIDFNKSLGNISFNISDYEINDDYKITYNYCLNNNNCFDSIEYLRPSIDQDFDKSILKLNVKYDNNSKLNFYTFYSFFNSFGDIYYLKDGVWNIQSDNFEQIISKKGKNNYNYIGINKSIKDSESIKLVFNIRGLKYEYLLK